MNTKLIEFYNTKKNIIRGIITQSKNTTEKNVICLHGFGRCSSTEKKFKVIADKLVKKNILTLRFDFSGFGLSDGDFSLTTIERQGQEFLEAIEFLKSINNSNKISIVTHSLGACVLATQLKKIQSKIDKIILVSPALNQKELLRYWFATQTNVGTEITWDNYHDYFKEEEFENNCRQKGKETKTDYINPTYFLDAKNKDFSNIFESIKTKVLHIHGQNDQAVPINSLNICFDNGIIVMGGDHDLEKPSMRNQWVDKAVDFLAK